jgi:hypothetical protein
VVSRRALSEEGGVTNQSSPAFVNFHFDFGDFAPVNSKNFQ